MNLFEQWWFYAIMLFIFTSGFGLIKKKKKFTSSKNKTKGKFKDNCIK